MSHACIWESRGGGERDFSRTQYTQPGGRGSNGCCSGPVCIRVATMHCKKMACVITVCAASGGERATPTFDPIAGPGDQKICFGVCLLRKKMAPHPLEEDVHRLPPEQMSDSGAMPPDRGVIVIALGFVPSDKRVVAPSSPYIHTYIWAGLSRLCWLGAWVMMMMGWPAGGCYRVRNPKAKPVRLAIFLAHLPSPSPGSSLSLSFSLDSEAQPACKGRCHLG